MKKNDLRAKRKLQRKRENKKFILEAAERVFSKKGYSQATVDDISDEAQFSKATIYRYFNSKSDIFSEVIMGSFLEARKNLLRICKKNKSAEDRVEEIIYFVLSYFRSKKNIARIFLMERSSMKQILGMDIEDHVMPIDSEQQIPDDYLKIIKDIFEAMCKIIQEGIDSGEFRKVDAREACLILGAMLRGFNFKGPLHKKEYSIEQSTELVYSFFLNGLKKTTD